MIKVDNLSVGYTKKLPPVISNLTFEVGEGEILTVLGQNGVGKTTLIRCLTREIEHYTGKILIEDTDIKELSIKMLSKEIGVVSSSINNYQDLLVADYLVTGFANQLSPLSAPKKEYIDKAMEVLEAFNKAELFNKPLSQLSSGERQIAMISRTIIQNPKIILFDEPMANLDVKNQILVLEQIKALSKNGYTTIVTTHNPGHSLALGGKVLLLGHNDILFGQVNEVITESVLSYYYDLPVLLENKNGYTTIVFCSKNDDKLRLIL